VHVPFRQLALTRRNLFQRDNHCCQYCGQQGGQLSIDHILPRSRGGLDRWENVTTACLRCNVRKGNRTPQEAKMPLRHQPHRPMGNLTFEARRQISTGQRADWAKYVIGP